ncbi:sulfated surface glycoprotein 185-like isoform X2 [Triticum urartu]|uniref:sulfated surface glycoprotein 185-like isoform X2 n=1 Tax=Triticum urartu TaxID=4572 RepID=UPI0020447E4D|nr:sulfated surface glycoprotein 185-like isoform X2 [Triticum urartu]XP_048572433.1 sulfated surface glycoprotein 185-like isoform X2 [Triticum urartu]
MLAATTTAAAAALRAPRPPSRSPPSSPHPRPRPTRPPPPPRWSPQTSGAPSSPRTPRHPSSRPPRRRVQRPEDLHDVLVVVRGGQGISGASSSSSMDPTPAEHEISRAGPPTGHCWAISAAPPSLRRQVQLLPLQSARRGEGHGNLTWTQGLTTSSLLCSAPARCSRRRPRRGKTRPSSRCSIWYDLLTSEG